MNREKKDYIWNTTAGLINASEAVIMSMIVTRTKSLADAGMLTIAFAIGNLMMSIGKFGIRNYQVTDVEKKFSFAAYLKVRMITVLFMAGAVAAYLFYACVSLGYSRKKLLVILAVCMIYTVETVEDVIWGYYQSRDRLYVGAKMFCYRWIGILAVFPIALHISGDLSLALFWCFGISVLIFLFFLRLSYPHICAEEDKHIALALQWYELPNMIEILKTAFPLFGIAFLSFYEHNAPKYAIDACLTDEVQACYGFVAMPVFVIELLNNFIYQPTLVPMAVEWMNGRIKEFRIRIMKQMIIIAGISIICITGAYFLGIPVLSLLYHTDLSGYKKELMILLFASVFLAISGYQSVILTIMRCQKILWIPHGIISVIAALGLKYIVAEYGTIGAAFSYLALMVALCMMYGIILVVKWKDNRYMKCEREG